MVIRQHGKVKVTRQAPTPTKPVQNTPTAPVKKATGTEGRKIVKKYNTSNNE